MKSLYLLTILGAVAAISSSSCSQNEKFVEPDNQSNAISFGTYIGVNPASRADEVSESLQALKDSGFGVFAYYTGEADYASSTIPNFMYNQLVEWKNEAWTYTPIKYWPTQEGHKISFFAYAPYRAAGSTTGITGFSANNATGDPMLSFEVSPNITEQVDLLYADATTQYAEDGSTVTNPLIDLTKPDNKAKVKFNFKHATASASFQCELVVDGTQNGQVADGTTVTMNEVLFNPGNLITKGDLNLKSGEWTNPTITEGGVQLTGLGFGSSSPYNLYFIPEPATKSETTPESSITVKYTVTTKDTNLASGSSEVTNTVVKSLDHITFMAGKRYTFKLKVGLTSVKIDATASDWETGETVEWSSEE